MSFAICKDCSWNIFLFVRLRCGESCQSASGSLFFVVKFFGLFMYLDLNSCCACIACMLLTASF